MQDSEVEARRKMAETPGLTRAQREAILNPGFSMVIAKNIVDALRRQAGSAFAAKSDEEKGMTRAFGGTEVVSLGVHMADSVTQRFGGAVEVPRNG